jgi:hypothetical protein
MPWLWSSPGARPSRNRHATANADWIRATGQSASGRTDCGRRPCPQRTTCIRDRDPVAREATGTGSAQRGACGACPRDRCAATSTELRSAKTAADPGGGASRRCDASSGNAIVSHLGGPFWRSSSAARRGRIRLSVSIRLGSIGLDTDTVLTEVLGGRSRTTPPPVRSIQSGQDLCRRPRQVLL